MFGLGFWDQNNKGGGFEFLPAADQPDHCWSTWLRNPSYTGPLIRIQKGPSTLNQMDIYANNNVVDTAAILSYVGTDSALVVKWYDQFGSAHLDRYATSTYAPIIADNGVVFLDDSGNPTIRWGQTSSRSTLMENLSVNVFPSRSTVIYSYKNTRNNYTAVAGSSNTNSGHCITHPTDTQFASIFWDPNPQHLFVNGVLKINTNSNATRANFHSELSTGNNLLVAEKDGAWAQGTGLVLGGRRGSITTYIVGEMNEYMIFNSILSDSKIQEIKGILNKSHKYY